MTENIEKLPYTNARLLAIQTIYAQSLTGEDWDKIVSRALLGELGGQVLEEQSDNYVTLEGADSGLYTRIIKSYQEQREDIERTIKEGLSEKIVYDRLELTFLCILRAGMAEFLSDWNTDSPIIINEYVDITQSFYSGPEIKIANGILDRFAKIIRE